MLEKLYSARNGYKAVLRSSITITITITIAITVSIKITLTIKIVIKARNLSSSVCHKRHKVAAYQYIQRRYEAKL